MVREVRGHGYLLGVSYVDPRDGESFLPPELRVGARVDQAAFEADLITLSTQPTRDGFAGDQTLFAPAFIASDDELDEMVSRFSDSAPRVGDRVAPSAEQGARSGARGSVVPVALRRLHGAAGGRGDRGVRPLPAGLRVGSLARTAVPPRGDEGDHGRLGARVPPRARRRRSGPRRADGGDAPPDRRQQPDGG